MSESTEKHADPADASAIVPNRVGVYGSVTDTYPRIAAMMQAVVDGNEIQAWHVPLLQICLKLVRTTEAPDYSDNSDDIEGYLAIFREIIGDDMVHARSVSEYLEKKARR